LEERRTDIIDSIGSQSHSHDYSSKSPVLFSPYRRLA
jgi:hypothetical protein